jgi:hypothetical protein
MWYVSDVVVCRGHALPEVAGAIDANYIPAEMCDLFWIK